MHAARLLVRRWSVLGTIIIAGCATVPEPSTAPSPDHQRFDNVEDAVSALSAPQSSSRAPVVRLYAPTTFSAARYVDASVSVTENAYVMVFAVDLDRRVRVIFPESPDESGYVASERPQQMERFFAGFGSANRSSFAFASNPLEPISRYGGTGVVIALASERPFQFDRIADSDGDWDEDAIGRLIFQTSVLAATNRLGSMLVLSGQHFSNDYVGFGGNNSFDRFSAYALGSSSGLGCGESDYLNQSTGVSDGFAYGPGYGYGGPSGALVRYTVFNGIRYASYLTESACGAFYYSPWQPIGPVIETTKPDSVRRDSSSAYRAGRIATVGGAASSGAGRTARPVDGTAARLPATTSTSARIRLRPTDSNADHPGMDSGGTQGTDRNSAAERAQRQDRAREQQQERSQQARDRATRQQEERQQQQQQQAQQKSSGTQVQPDRAKP